MRGNFFYEKLGKNLSKVRRKYRLSQRCLAFLTHIDRTYLIRLEKGKVNPSIKTLYRLCRCMRVKVREIVKDL